MNTPVSFQPVKRLGYHYFPDSLHYRQADLNFILPTLKSLGARWLTLAAPNDRAIPEFFISALIKEKIRPILQFESPPDAGIWQDLALLLHEYANWGIRLVSFFDSPNMRNQWPASAWAQEDLVERFLDRYLPCANLALAEGLTPISPPLEPGGDYWDIIFLKGFLKGLQRRGQNDILDQFVAGAYAIDRQSKLTWGAGGPAGWPDSRPYFTPEGSEDQRGLCLADWYSVVIRQELGGPRPIYLLRVGSLLNADEFSTAPESALNSHAKRNEQIVQAIAATLAETTGALAFPQEVEAACLWPLVASPESELASQAWLQADGSELPVMETVRNTLITLAVELPLDESTPTETTPPLPLPLEIGQRKPIAHYLLLQPAPWGVSDWDLAAVQTFILEQKPTIGFLINEAEKAARVTILDSNTGGANTATLLAGGTQEDANEAGVDPLAAIETRLREAGCQVKRLTVDGTFLAPIAI